MFVIFSVNFWHGVCLNVTGLQLFIYCGYMVCVSFAEETVFRGFLFQAMAKDGIISALLVSSVTFGLGHIYNFLNGSADLLPTLLQMGYAMSVGLLFAVIVWKGKSIVPAILAHTANNVLSVFANEAVITTEARLFSAAALCMLSLAYAWYIFKNV